MKSTSWLALAGAGCLGGFFGLCLQPRPAAAKTVTLYGSIGSMKDKSGQVPLTFQFKDRHTGAVLATKRGVATVDKGEYVVDLNAEGLNGEEVYAVRALEAQDPAVTYIRLQASFPGTVDAGHANLSGTMKMDRLRIGTITAAGPRIRVEDATGSGAILAKSNSIAVNAVGTGASDSVAIGNNGTGDGMTVYSTGNQSDAIFASQSNPLTRAVIEATHYGAGSVRVLSVDHQNTTGSSTSGFFINRSQDGTAVYADTYDTTHSGNTNVWAEHRSVQGTAIFGRIPLNASGYGVYGDGGSGGTGHAVYANGRLTATGTKSFQIDHPLSPTTMYLNHYCSEGPEPYNVYRGSVRLDSTGAAWVQLPAYFSAINKNETYTLTAVGAPMPGLFVAQKAQAGRFRVSGGAPNGEVDWCVTGVRNDRWVQAYGFRAEEKKPQQLAGTYVDPEVWGQPEAKGQNYRPLGPTVEAHKRN